LVLAYTRKIEGFIGFIGFIGFTGFIGFIGFTGFICFTVYSCTDDWSWHSFLLGFSHWVYCIGFNEADGEYWVYVLSLLICACCFVFHGNTGRSKGGSVAISHL